MGQKIKPLNNQVWLKVVDTGEQIRGGVIIPPTAEDPRNIGDVVAVGPGKRTDSGGRLPLDVRPGDRVLFSQYQGHTVKVDGEEYLVVREEEVQAVLS